MKRAREEGVKRKIQRRKITKGSNQQEEPTCDVSQGETLGFGPFG